VKELKLKACRPHILQMLTEGDFDRRVEFSECFLIRCETEPDFPRRILWTDVASFKLNGRINRHDSVYWIESNPHTGGIKCSWSNCLGRHLEWRHRGSFLFYGDVTGEL
jgi:hypothetical protein